MTISTHQVTVLWGYIFLVPYMEAECRQAGCYTQSTVRLCNPGNDSLWQPTRHYVHCGEQILAALLSISPITIRQLDPGHARPNPPLARQ